MNTNMMSIVNKSAGMILFCVFIFFLFSCGGGGGGNSGGTTTKPFISAILASYPTGSEPSNYHSAWVVIRKESISGDPISDATVNLNGVSFTYDSASNEYKGNVLVAPGGNVTLNVLVGGITYTIAGTQFTSYPVIIVPLSGSALVASMGQAVSWSNVISSTNASYFLGVMDAANPNGLLIWPSNNFIQDAMNATTFTIPKDSLTIGNRLLIVGIATALPIPNAASGSGLMISGINSIPITVTAPTTLATGLSRAHGITIDSTDVFFTENLGGTIKKVGINGGTVTTIASALINPVNITADANNLYFTNYNYSNIGTVMKIGKNGGALSTLASGIVGPYDVAVDSSNVYWTGSQSINKADLNGVSSSSLASWLDSAFTHAMVLDSSSVYWVDPFAGAIKKVSINGGSTSTLASGLTNPAYIAVDSNNVYWTEPNAVKKVGLNGGIVTTLTSSSPWPGSIAVDSTNIYWIDNSDNILKKMSKNGGVASTLAGGLFNPTAIAVDSSNVYWIDNDGGVIKKIAK